MRATVSEALGRPYDRIRIEDADHSVNVVEVCDKGAQLTLGMFDPSRRLAALINEAGKGVGAFGHQNDPSRSREVRLGSPYVPSLGGSPAYLARMWATRIEVAQAERNSLERETEERERCTF